MIGKTEAQLTAEGVSYEVRVADTASSVGNRPHYFFKVR